MIHVDRSRSPAPKILSSPRAEKEREYIANLLSRKEKLNLLDQVRFKFLPALHKPTKDALLKLFSGKCAYCERTIDARNAFIEHYRPAQRAEGLDGRVDVAHYAWLAYEWDNLLLACSTCSQRLGKANRFPVAGERAPLAASVDECREQEQALLLDPCFDHPAEHLEFKDIGTCEPLTERGRVTIDVIGLNRRALVRERRRVWADTLTQFRSLLVDAELSAEERARRVDKMSSPESPHLATVNAAFDYARDRFKELEIARAKDLALSAIAGDEEARALVVGAPEILEPKALEATLPALEAVAKAVPEGPTAPNVSRAELPRYAHHKIRRVEIRNFKAIKSLDLDVPTTMPDNDRNAGALMLLGENASGKSTVLEAIAMTLLGTEQLEWLKLRAADFVRRSRGWDAPLEDEEPAEVRVYFDDDGPALTLRIDPGDPEFKGNARPATVLLGYGPRRFFPADVPRRRSQPGERLRTMFDPLALVPNPEGWLMNRPQSQFNAVVRALREVLLLPKEALVARDGKQILFEIQGETAPLDQLSDGYKTIVATSVDVMREMLDHWRDLESAAGVVMIDELETHLHPRWKMRIARSLREAMPNVQFLMTTHDPICLRGMKHGEVQVLYREPGSGVDRLVGLPDVQGLSVEQLLTSDFFGLHSAEDPELEADVSRYVALAAKRARSPLEEAELADRRRMIHKTMTLGGTREEQVLHEAMNRYTQGRQEASKAQHSKLKAEAINKMVDLWESMAVEDSES